MMVARAEVAAVVVVTEPQMEEGSYLPSVPSSQGTPGLRVKAKVLLRIRGRQKP